MNHYLKRLSRALDIDIPSAELHNQMVLRVSEVAKRTGFTTPITVIPSFEDNHGMSAWPGRNTIDYGSAIAVDDPDIDGAIAHEIGHLALEWPTELSRSEQEILADRYAVKHGYGGQFINHLLSDREHTICSADCAHGDPEERIARLRRMMIE